MNRIRIFARLLKMRGSVHAHTRRECAQRGGEKAGRTVELDTALVDGGAGDDRASQVGEVVEGARLNGASAEQAQAVLNVLPAPLRRVDRSVWHARYARHDHWEL